MWRQSTFFLIKSLWNIVKMIIDEAGTLYNNLIEDFEVHLDDDEVESDNFSNGTCTSTNAYFIFLHNAMGLEVLQESKVRLAYKSNAEVGLFHLFFTSSYL